MQHRARAIGFVTLAGALATLGMVDGCAPDPVLRGQRLGVDGSAAGAPVSLAGAPGGGQGGGPGAAPDEPPLTGAAGQPSPAGSSGGAGRDADVSMPPPDASSPMPSVDAAPVAPGISPECRAPGDGRLLELSGNNATLPATAAHPAGVWRPIVDGSSGTVALQVAPSDPSRCAASTALRFRGSGFTSWGAMAQGYWDQGPVNLSAFTGVRVSLRAAAPITVRLKVPDKQVHPTGGSCTKCDDAFGAELPVTTAWRDYVVPFTTMRQEGWGVPQFVEVDRRQILGVEVLVRQNQAFDVFIGDVTLYK